MAIVEIPLPRSSTPISKQRTPLEGVSYLFKFRFNSRANRWFFSIYDSEDTPVVINRLLAAQWPLLKSVSVENAPPGDLFLFTVDGEDPDLEGIDGARLIYQES